MALLVQKFGGTSLSNLEYINRAADIIAKAKQDGHKIVVIVSAMAGETDRLIQLASSMSEIPNEREYAALVSTGEQVSMALMAMALINRGINARSYTGGQARIQTSNNFKKARIQAIDVQPLLKALEEDVVTVIAGFQGIDREGSITTLGRGGSDTTAVAIAAALKADECQIYTDVDGVYTSDPRIVPDAKRLSSVTFEEMLELSSLGAKVLQIRAVEFAGKYKIPLRVLSSYKDGPGTLITYQNKNAMEMPFVTGIAVSKQEAKITCAGAANTTSLASFILSEINALSVNADMFVQHTSTNNKVDITFTVHQDEYLLTLNHLKKMQKQLSAQDIVGEDNLAKLSLVGAGLKSHPEVASIMFKTLAANDISVQLIATSEIKISVLIDSKQLETGVRALHTEFQLDNESYEETRTIPTIAAVQ